MPVYCIPVLSDISAIQEVPAVLEPRIARFTCVSADERRRLAYYLPVNSEAEEYVQAMRQEKAIPTSSVEPLCTPNPNLPTYRPR